MGVYTRYKQAGAEGFRALVELLETTPQSRRKRMIEVGMAEDPDYTERALEYVLTFEDILNLPDPELAEVCAKAPPRTISIAINSLGEDTHQRFLRCCKPQIAAEVKDSLGSKASLSEIGGAQLKMIEFTRQLEKQGYIRSKKIPL